MSQPKRAARLSREALWYSRTSASEETLKKSAMARRWAKKKDSQEEVVLDAVLEKSAHRKSAF